VRLALDHHYSPLIAVQLRDRGHEAAAALERGWEAEDDDTLFQLCAAEQLTLLTNNVVDFVHIARQWGAEGRSHPGLVVTSDDGLPRSRDTIGRYVELLDALMLANLGPGDFADRIHWLNLRR
jgi:hypothetical protein